MAVSSAFIEMIRGRTSHTNFIKLEALAVQEYVLWYQELGMHDVGRVGGKNASLGEMISNLANFFFFF